MVPPRPPKDPPGEQPRHVPKPFRRPGYKFPLPEDEPTAIEPPRVDPFEPMPDPEGDPFFKEPDRPPEIEVPPEPGVDPDGGEPPLETPDGVSLEEFEKGFEDNDDFFHEDYSPDEDEVRLTPQTQEQESGQNARLLNLWFRNFGQDLIRGQLPGLNANIGQLLQPRLRALLEANLLTEYAIAEIYYANLFAKVFGQQRNGGEQTGKRLFLPRANQADRGFVSDAELRVAAGVAITGLGLLASYGFLYRGGRGGFVGRGAVSGLLDLSAP